MLNSSQFFGNLVSQYVARYNSLAERFGASAISTPPTSQIEKAPTPGQPSLNAQRRDKAELAQPPRLEAPLANTAQKSKDSFEPQKRSGEALSESHKKPESTTYSSSFTNLRYGLGLRFNLQAIERTVKQLSVTSASEKTTTDETLERLFAGGFGFSADLQLSGISVKARTTSNGSDDVARRAEHGAGRYHSQETGPKARELQNSAAETKKSLPDDTRQNYQVAVNRFSLRYKTDTRFSVSHFSRFQSHVERLNDKAPDSLKTYTNQAGQLAQNAPNEVVGQFFDTVDGYLQNKEKDLVAKTGRFFDMAAQSLGLSAEAVATAKESVTHRIESFFDSVESSLNTLEGRFNQPASVGAVKPTGAPEMAPRTAVSLDAAKAPQVRSQLASASPQKEHSLLSDLISTLKPHTKPSAESDKKRPTKKTLVSTPALPPKV